MAGRGATLVERIIELPDHGSTVVADIAGPEGAPVVMLLHGLGATARLNWGRCFEPLSQHFRVLTLDQRGHGRGLRTRRFSLEEGRRRSPRGGGVGGAIRRVGTPGRTHRSLAGAAIRRVAGLVLCPPPGTSRPGRARIARRRAHAAAAARASSRTPP